MQVDTQREGEGEGGGEGGGGGGGRETVIILLICPVCCRWHCYSCCTLILIQTATNSGYFLVQLCNVILIYKKTPECTVFCVSITPLHWCSMYAIRHCQPLLSAIITSCSSLSTSILRPVNTFLQNYKKRMKNELFSSELYVFFRWRKVHSSSTCTCTHSLYTGTQKEEDLYVRLIDSCSKQVCAHIVTSHVSPPRAWVRDYISYECDLKRFIVHGQVVVGQTVVQQPLQLVTSHFNCFMW